MNIDETTPRETMISRHAEILNSAKIADRGLTASEKSELNDIEREVRSGDMYAQSHGSDGKRVSRPNNSIDASGFPESAYEPIQAQAQPSIAMPSIGRMKSFQNTRQGEAQAYAAGRWIQASLLGDAKSARWCNEHGVGVKSALAGGVATAGGVLVPDELSSSIIRLVEEYGLFRRSTNVLTMSSDTLNRPRRTGGLTAYYVGEGQAGTEDSASWDNVSLVAKKLMILTRMSSEINEDAVIDLADTMAQEIALAFALAEDQAGFNGDGTSSYGGITGAFVKAIDGNHGLAVVEAASGVDTLPEITATDLINLMAAIPVYARMGSAWYCSPTAQAVVIDAIKIAGGGNTAGDLSELGVPRFLGYPVYVSDVLPDSVTTVYNDIPMLAFGNLQQAATMGARRDITIALSTEQYWEEDQIGIKGTERYDINVHDLGSATDKSPFAVLIGTT